MTSAADEPVPARWRTVILRHDLPDGSSHFDWMFQPPAGFPRDSAIGSAGLVTFRCESRPDELKPGTAQTINRLSDHRETYLDYEGLVLGDRGQVARVRAGQIACCRVVAVDGSSGDWNGWELEIDWINGENSRQQQVFRLIPQRNDAWTVFSARQNPANVSH
jgi:hypothetical protein